MITFATTFADDSARYVVFIDDSYSLTPEEREVDEDGILYKCELDLDTMVWTRKETIGVG